MTNRKKIVEVLHCEDGIWLVFGKYTLVHIDRVIGNAHGIVEKGILTWVEDTTNEVATEEEIGQILKEECKNDSNATQYIEYQAKALVGKIATQAQGGSGVTGTPNKMIQQLLVWRSIGDDADVRIKINEIIDHINAGVA